MLVGHVNCVNTGYRLDTCSNISIQFDAIKSAVHDHTLQIVNTKQLRRCNVSKKFTNTCFHHVYNIYTTINTWKRCHLYDYTEAVHVDTCSLLIGPNMPCGGNQNVQTGGSSAEEEQGQMTNVKIVFNCVSSRKYIIYKFHCTCAMLNISIYVMHYAIL